MTHFLRATTVVLASALLCTGCGSHSKISAGEVKALVLAQSDLPASFQSFAEGPTATLDTQGTPRASLQRFGRKGGWVARFHRGGTDAGQGPLVIVSAADVFADAGGARSDLDAYRAQFERQIADQGAKPLRVSDLANEGVALTSLQPGSKAIRSFTIAWRERNATGYVSANGFEGRIRFGEILRLARRQAARMARA